MCRLSHERTSQLVATSLKRIMIKDIFRVLHESYQIGRVHARVFEDYKNIRIADIVNNTVIQAVIMLVFDRRSFQAAVAFTVIAGKDTCQEHVAQTACIT